MSNYKIAWRNLWRNKRRTLITVASVFFAVFFALIMRSMQLGTYNHMFRNAIESYTGYLQIQHEDFRDDRIVDNAFEYSPELDQAILNNKNVLATIPRFESFALASSGNLTKGVLVIGVDPDKEKYLSDLEKKMVRYRITDKSIQELKNSGLPEKYRENLEIHSGSAYSGKSLLLLDMGIANKDTSDVLPLFDKCLAFENGFIRPGESGALIGDKLSSFLNIGIGDSLVLIGQGWQGTTAAGLFRVNGIIRMPTSDMDNKIVYLPLDVCQKFYNAPGMVTSVAAGVKSNNDSAIDRMIAELSYEIPPPLKVLGWRKLNELLINQMDADSKSGMIMIGILYLVIAFGIFGTVLMMTAERKREFGVLVAVGMQKSKLSAVVSLEMFYIGLMGIVSGILMALPVILYGYYHPLRFKGDMAKMFEDYGMEPVMPFLPVNWYFVWQSVVVAIIIVIAMAYPVRKIYKMQIVNSLKA
jgi:ABC-type lipoprotein release transport system permease subunit